MDKVKVLVKKYKKQACQIFTVAALGFEILLILLKFQKISLKGIYTEVILSIIIAIIIFACCLKQIEYKFVRVIIVIFICSILILNCVGIILYDPVERHFISPSGKETLVIVETSVLYTKDIYICREKFIIFIEEIGSISTEDDFSLRRGFDKFKWLSDKEIIFSFKFNNRLREYEINLDNLTIEWKK